MTTTLTEDRDDDDVDLAPMEMSLLPPGDVMSMLLGTEPFVLLTFTMEDGAVTPRVVTGGGLPQSAQGVTEAVDLLHGYLHQGAVTEVEAQP